jgi:hypothetical protein
MIFDSCHNAADLGLRRYCPHGAALFYRSFIVFSQIGKVKSNGCELASDQAQEEKQGP